MPGSWEGDDAQPTGPVQLQPLRVIEIPQGQLRRVVHRVKKLWLRDGAQARGVGLVAHAVLRERRVTIDDGERFLVQPHHGVLPLCWLLLLSK
jgi:hypothetical protein